MSAKDKQRLAIAIGLVVVVAAALYLLVFRKKAETGAEQAPAATTAARPGGARGVAMGRTGRAGAVAASKAGALGAKAPALGAKGPVTQAQAAALFAAALAAKAAAPAATTTPLEDSRPDPFASLIPPPPPIVYHPPPLPVAVVQVGIPPVMAAALPLESIIGGVGQRRTAGVLWNDRVLAIIETEKTVAVVQPGDTVDGEMVRSISPEGLVLAVKGGQEVDVPLRAAEAGTRRPALVTPASSPELPGAPTSSEYQAY